MDWTSAPNIADAPLEPAQRLFSPRRFVQRRDRLEAFLEAERGAASAVVRGRASALGIAAWFALPGPRAWAGLHALAARRRPLTGLAWRGGRAGRALAGFGLALALGCALIWCAVRAGRGAAARAAARSPTFDGTGRAGRDACRQGRPPADACAPPQRPAAAGAGVDPAAKARPTGLGRRRDRSSVKRAARSRRRRWRCPATHDFARDAWFRGIGGVGRAIGPVDRHRARATRRGLDAMRDAARRAHPRPRCPGRAAAIATALATGDQNAVSEEDAEAMRRSGLTHLLSVSGLHIAAVVGAAMLLSLRLLALSRAARAALQPGAGRGRGRRAGRGRLHLADRHAGADGAQLHRRLAGARRDRARAARRSACAWSRSARCWCCCSGPRRSPARASS